MVWRSECVVLYVVLCVVSCCVAVCCVPASPSPSRSVVELDSDCVVLWCGGGGGVAYFMEEVFFGLRVYSALLKFE